MIAFLASDRPPVTWTTARGKPLHLLMDDDAAVLNLEASLHTPVVLAAVELATVTHDAFLVSREDLPVVAETKRNTIRQRPILDRCGLPLCTQS